MYSIFKSEFTRYRNWALILMMVHLGVAWLIHKAGLLFLGNNSPVLGAEWLGGAVAGLLFGLLQIGLHRRPNNWAYLIHRPLVCSQTFIGLLLAAIALIGIVLFIPSLLIINALDIFTAHSVDMRHYLFPLHIFGISFCAYLVGVYTQLYPNKTVLISAWLLSYFMIFNLYTTPLTTFVPLLVVTIWLFYLCQQAFKPDLETHFSKISNIVLAALPLQMALGFLIMFMQMPFYHN